MFALRWLQVAAMALVVGLRASCFALPSSSASRSCDTGFQLRSGAVVSGRVLESRAGVLSLPRCIALCADNDTCVAANFEPGLCVLVGGPTGPLVESQLPTFSMAAQKTCLQGAASCASAWHFEVLTDRELRTTVRRRRRLASLRECEQLCLQERDFVCRSGNYRQETGDCALADIDRFTAPGLGALAEEVGVEYFESNCGRPAQLCDFTTLHGRLLKTADVVLGDVASFDRCRQLCLRNTDFHCRTFDYGYTGPKVCRLSHHAAASVGHLREPFLELDGAASQQLGACYNVSVDCRTGDMLARVTTSKVFNGKLYARSRPHSCGVDVVNSLRFELRLGYNDLSCDVTADAQGRYTSEIVIQHHDQIVTSQDMGVTVHCSYRMQNRSVGLGIELQVGDAGPSETEHDAFVSPPSVSMRITDRRGDDIHAAQVGDALSLRFDVLDRDSPYQIFVRELIALDGVDSSEILLVDSLGCPTDPTIMGPVTWTDTADGSKVLQAPFDAFKFPTSDVVQFKALVTPCLPTCEPALCEVEDYYGTLRRVNSSGRRRRREVDAREEMLLVQSIRIADKFEARPEPRRRKDAEVSYASDTYGFFCLSSAGIAYSVATFVCAQTFVILGWLYVFRRNKSEPRRPWYALGLPSW